MADWSELKAIMLPFPCLWDSQDPYFSDETVKAACREHVLKICNQRSGVAIDMESLEQCIADNLKQSTRTLQTATEKLPITTLPQGPSKVTELAQEITSTEKVPVTTSPRKCSSVRRKVGGNRARRKPKLDHLFKDYPCLWNPEDLNYRDNTMRRQCLELLLLKFNRLSSTDITMDDLKRKLMTMRKRLYRYRVATGKSSSSSAVASQGMPKLKDLVKEFPSLWDPNDLNYSDNNIRARYRHELLVKFNSVSSIPITMSDLKRKLKVLQKKDCRNEPKLQDLLKEFPSLWDPNDLNYSDNNIRARYREELLVKFNSVSSIPITMYDLQRKLAALQKSNCRNEPKLKILLKEFPCLWDPNDLNFSDVKIRARCQRELLEKFNRLSSTQINMSDLKRKLAAFYQRLYVRKSKERGLSPLRTENQEPKLQDLLKEFPSLWDPNDLNYSDYKIRARHRQELLVKFNRISSITITMSDLKRKLEALQKTDCRNEPKLQDLLKEFPSLWDSNDLYYSDDNIRDRYRQELLVKFNSVSSTPITMSDLKRMLAALQKSNCRNEPQLKILLKEFPCLWDPNDLNSSDFKIRALSQRELLEKFNRLSFTQINMSDLKRKLAAFQKRLYRSKSKGKGLSPLQSEKQEKTQRQTKVQEISEGHLETMETAGGENEVQEITADNFRALFDNSQTDPEACIDSTDSNQRPQDTQNQETLNQETLVLRGLEVVFNYCRFCGELKNFNFDTNDIKPYVANNKCTLIINDLRAELEFTDDVLPRNICKDCDRKFQEMVDFVKCVKDTQVKLNKFNNKNIDRRRKNEDSLAENDIESEKDTDGRRKKCKITIDFNSDKLPSLSDNCDENNDIEMNNDDEIESFLVIDTESEESNGSRVSIIESSPSLSLYNENNGNTNSTMSHCHRAETATNLTTHADFLKNKPLNHKVYVTTRRLSQKTHHKSTKDFEDDINSIVINNEDEATDDNINDEQEQLNAEINLYDDIDIKEEDIYPEDSSIK